MAEQRHVGDSGASITDVHHAQPDGTPDRGIRPVARAERAEACGDVAVPHDRAVHDHQRRGAVRGGLHLGEVELGLEQRSDRGHDDGHVVRYATGHHRVRRDLLDRGRSAPGTHLTEVHVGIETGGEYETSDALRCRDHDRQPIRARRGMEEFECRCLVDGVEHHAGELSGDASPRNTATIRAAEASATRAMASCPDPATGCGRRRRGRSGIPADAATESPWSQNCSVTSATEGTPRRAASMPSRTVPDVQLPQCP